LQRRPVVSCTDSTECTVDEQCQGLDPTKSDTDGDGVPDQQEDPTLSGNIDPVSGQTDPRLFDTDGDGVSDKDSGAKICRPDGLAMVTIVSVPGGGTQLGHDPVWGAAVPVTGTTNRTGLILNDNAASVAGFVLVRAAAGADVRADATAVESAISLALGAGVTSILVGRSLTTHENNPAISSSYRVVQNTSASALRDKLVNPLIGAAAPASPVIGASTEFIVDITTVRVFVTNQVIVTVAPRTLYENTMVNTSIRANDLYNTTGVAIGGKTLTDACQGFIADKAAVADFVWTVDTSGSMDDDQARLGNTAKKFFARLNSAGVDFRVGVLNAGSTLLNIDTPGFKFINGTDPTGPQQLCRQVTQGLCPGDTTATDTLKPYPMGGSSEEPTAAAILMLSELKRRASINETNLDRRLRPGALPVAFLVTDEPGSNDYTRYFQSAKDPDNLKAWGATYNATTLGNIVAFFKRNNFFTFGMVPVSNTACTAAAVADLPRCVVEGNGGASINITTALDNEVAAAMDRIVDAVAGATSQFKLTRSPITSTIKVNVRGIDVPRSRNEGFDYDPASKSVVFYGTQFRPKLKDSVIISYRVWAGSIG
jgi:hypothetical protein